MNLLDMDVKEAALGFGDDEWEPPSSFPDLTGYDRIAIDLETRDPNITTLTLLATIQYDMRRATCQRKL